MTKAKKINKKGEFLPYKGITVVCPLSNEQKRNLNKVQKWINSSKTMSKYFSGLPQSSYHMTLYDIITENQLPGDTLKQTLIDGRETLSRLNSFLSMTTIRPIMEIVNIYASGTIGLRLSFIDAHVQNIAYVCRNSIDTILNRVPREYVFHMTLGYQYKAIEPEDIQNMEEEMKEFKNLILNYCPDTLLKFEEARLCYFNDMLSFVTWNGEDVDWLNINNSNKKDVNFS